MNIFLRYLRVFLVPLLPPAFLRRLMSLYGFIIRPTKSYSQKGEDLIVKQYFKKLGIEKGVYVDVGCFHPKWISNTYLLHKIGWKGIAVDIDKYKLDTFKSSRGEAVEVIEGAVTGELVDDNSKAIVYKFRSKQGWSDIDTLDRDTALKQVEKGAGSFIESKVNLININALLDGIGHVNFLNIDVEGLDTGIVENIDFDKYKIDLIIYEDHKNFGGSKEISMKLKKFGYIHIFTSGGSVCFAKSI